MTEKPPTGPDYNALAKQYLDLWQEQLGKLAREPMPMADPAAWSQFASAMMQNAGGA